MDAIYTAEALATGGGRDGGHVATDDGRVDLGTALPTSMGGDGQGTNPEQLFASGYAACFLGALLLVARNAKADAEGASVGAKVGIGSNGAGGFQLGVTLEIVLPNLPHDEALKLAEQAHEVCPYSNATRGNIDVELVVTDD